MGPGKFLPQARQYCRGRVVFSLFGHVYGAFDYRYLVLFRGLGSQEPPVCAQLVSCTACSQNALLPGPDTAPRTGDGRLLSLCWSCFHFLPPLRRGSAVAVPKAGAIFLGLPFLDGHRAIFQERGYQCFVYFQAPVVSDQALPLKLVHEFAHPWARSTNHLRQG